MGKRQENKQAKARLEAASQAAQNPQLGISAPPAAQVPAHGESGSKVSSKNCLRCPEGVLFLSDHVKHPAHCLKDTPLGDPPNYSMIWPNFQDEASSESAVESLLNDKSDCEAVLKAAKAGDTEFKGIVISKQILEYAYQTCHKQAEKKSKKPSGAATNSAATTSSPAHAQTVDDGLPALQNLAISADVEGAVGPASDPAEQIERPGTKTDTVPLQPSQANVRNDQSTPSRRQPRGVPLNLPELPSTANTGARRPQSASAASRASAGQLWANHFKVSLTPGSKLFEYQLVGIQDATRNLSKPKKKVLIQRAINMSSTLKDQTDAFAFNNEGKIIAWKGLRPGSQLNEALDLLDVPNFDRDAGPDQEPEGIPIDLVYRRQIDLDDLSNFVQGNNLQYRETGAAQALDILIGRGVEDSQDEKIVKIGDNRFFTLDDAHDFKMRGMIAIRGFSSAVNPAYGNLLLNVNTALSAFYKDQLVSEYVALLPSRDQDAMRTQAWKDHLIGLRVYIQYDRCKPNEADKSKDTKAGRTKTITGFSTRPATKIMFADRTGKEVSVWDHFSQTYPTAAQTSLGGAQICVNTGSTQEGKECWFLADQLQVVPGQIYRKTLPPAMTEQMIGWACASPETNRNAILQHGLPALQLHPNRQDPAVLRDAGVSISRDMIKVSFRQITTPKVRYRDENVSDMKGPSAWQTKGYKFLKTTTAITSRIDFITLPGGLKNPAQGANYINAFNGMYWRNGISKVNDKDVAKVWRSLPSNENSWLNSLNDQKTGLFVAALDSGSKTQYSLLRALADQKLGKPLIVFNEDRMAGLPTLGGYMASNAMKINLRLGNENHTVADGFTRLLKGKDCDTLVLGADLIHPKQSSPDGTPTIAALVGSVDGVFAKFLGSARRQEKCKEYIDGNNMLSMAKERIAAWKELNKGKLPDRILYYRDGTGNTQYGDVRTHEVAAIKQAWNNIAGAGHRNEVKMTTVIAIKRHNTRFFPIDAKSSTNNCMPGTVVDRDITSPYYFDFYLQSHDVQKKGSSAKPTHYFVLENGMNFGEQDLQDLTHNFCYIYAHSDSAVSYAAPAYYADKLCERVSLYLRRFYDNDADVRDGVMSKDHRERAIEADWNRGGQTGNPWNAKFNRVMFWM